MRGMNAARLAEMARKVAEAHPDAELTPNVLGNLAISVGRRYAGWLDLDDGSIHWDDDERDGAA
jgi:hypothetical protein